MRCEIIDFYGSTIAREKHPNLPSDEAWSEVKEEKHVNVKKTAKRLDDLKLSLITKMPSNSQSL